jgi:hypothetical protein
MITKGYEQLVLSVKGAKKIATVERFDNLIENVVPDESSPDGMNFESLLTSRRHTRATRAGFSQRIKIGMMPSHCSHSHIAQVRKVIDYDYAQLAYVRLLLYWQFVLSAKDT